MSDAPPQDERPNLRRDEYGHLIIDLRDDLSPGAEIKRLNKITEIVEDSENLEEAQRKVDEEFKEVPEE